MEYGLLTAWARLTAEPPITTTILLFDHDDHSAVPTCARPRCRAQQRSRMPVGHRRRRREASWTAASTTAPSSQRRTTMQRPWLASRPWVKSDAPDKRGFPPPLTDAAKRWTFLPRGCLPKTDCRHERLV